MAVGIAGSCMPLLNLSTALSVLGVAVVALSLLVLYRYPPTHSPTHPSTGVGSAIQLSTYDRVKHAAVESGFVAADGFYADFTAALTSGFFVCLGMNPFDVVSTRIYNQRVDPVTGKGVTYRSPLDCLVKTMRAEGVAGLYKGFFGRSRRGVTGGEGGEG